jgi:hypothetical protein
MMYLSGRIVPSPAEVDATVAGGSVDIWTSWLSSPQIGSSGSFAGPALDLDTGALGLTIRSADAEAGSCSSSLPSESSSSPLPSEPLRKAAPLLSLRFFLCCLLGTSLKSANRMISSACLASTRSTLADNRALACAVDRRIKVSRVRAVSGEV